MLIPEPLKRLIKRPFPLVRAVYVRIRRSRLTLTNRFSRTSVIQPGRPVVSLTTYGERATTVHLVVESIASGSVRPSRLILWLDDARMIAELPQGIKRLQTRGLEVKLSAKNYGPHTKYYPYLESEEAFKVPLVTADDDILYPKHWLKRLVEAFERDPETVSCYRARVVTFHDGEMASYAEWPECKSVQPSFLHFATGVSGVIYPPRLLAGLKKAGTSFELCCPKADDIWLHAQALRAGCRVRQIAPRSVLFPRMPGTQEVALKHGNVMSDSGNDRQARLTYTAADLQVLRSEGGPEAGWNLPAISLRERIRMAWHAVIYGVLCGAISFWS